MSLKAECPYCEEELILPRVEGHGTVVCNGCYKTLPWSNVIDEDDGLLSCSLNCEVIAHCGVENDHESKLVDFKCPNCNVEHKWDILSNEGRTGKCHSCKVPIILEAVGMNGGRTIWEAKLAPVPPMKLETRCRKVICGATISLEKPLVVNEPRYCQCDKCGEEFYVKLHENGGTSWLDVPKKEPPMALPIQGDIKCTGCEKLTPCELIPERMNIIGCEHCHYVMDVTPHKNGDGSTRMVIESHKFAPAPVPPASTNHNEGKPRPVLLYKDFRVSLAEVLKVREMGVKKYDRFNWELSIGEADAGKFLEDNNDSMIRHIQEHLDGCNKDEESDCHPLAHLALRALMAIEYDLRKVER